MEGGTKNLCAQIPIDLHRRVREHQEQSGKSLGEYMTWLITTFYQSEEEQKMTNTETRTVAFQVPAELFEAFKDYLQRRGMKQKDFSSPASRVPSRTRSPPLRRSRRSRRREKIKKNRT